ncbi:MAG TPA: nuclear transport factor 2 family protein [Steroidobacteraceae bacterium]|nr:nuclear transport factor 2 family protein [Steroidobacteraceae bacterium]
MRTHLRFIVASAAAAVLGAVAAAPVLADPSPAAVTALLDRAQIEDILVDYYSHLGGADRDLGTYYTEDGVLDVNGLIGKGRKGIEEVYRKTAEGSPRLAGKFHMLLSNPRVVVTGDTATADVIWTGVVSENAKATPRFVEQGREHDELVKRQGKWYFKYRVITSDGGLPKMFEPTYKDR